MSGKQSPGSASGKASTRMSIEAALQQLQVRQLELQMQNEALRESQRRLEECRDLFANLFESTPVPSLTLSSNGKIEEINPACVSMIGLQQADIVGSALPPYFHVADRGALQKILERAGKEAVTQSGEFRLQRPDGEQVTVFLQCTNIARDPETHKLVLALTDLSFQKRKMELRQQFIDHFQKLTERERDVLRLALAGLANKDISTKLGISMRTIETHRSRIYMKTGFDSLLELVRAASFAEISLAEIIPPQASAKTRGK